MEAKDTLLVLNKTDALPNLVTLDSIRRRYPNGIPVSAHTGEGLDRFAVAVSDALSRSFRNVDVETDVGNGRLLAYLAAHGEIVSRQYVDNRVIVHCRLPRKFLGKIDDPTTVVRRHSVDCRKK